MYHCVGTGSEDAIGEGLPAKGTSMGCLCGSGALLSRGLYPTYRIEGPQVRNYRLQRSACSGEAELSRAGEETVEIGETLEGSHHPNTHELMC